MAGAMDTHTTTAESITDRAARNLATATAAELEKQNPPLRPARLYQRIDAQLVERAEALDLTPMRLGSMLMDFALDQEASGKLEFTDAPQG